MENVGLSRTQTLSLPPITFCLCEVYFGAPTSHWSVSGTYVVSQSHNYRGRRRDAQFWTSVAGLFHCDFLEDTKDRVNHFHRSSFGDVRLKLVRFY